MEGGEETEKEADDLHNPRNRRLFACLSCAPPACCLLSGAGRGGPGCPSARAFPQERSSQSGFSRMGGGCRASRQHAFHRKLVF